MSSHRPAVRDAASAIFAAALLKVARPVQVDHSRKDLLHCAASLSEGAGLSAPEQSLLRRLLTVVGDDESSPERVRRGVVATYRGLSRGRS